MIISEKQIMYLMEAVRAYRNECGAANHPDSLVIAKELTRLLKDILEQQSEELRVVE